MGVLTSIFGGGGDGGSSGKKRQLAIDEIRGVRDVDFEKMKADIEDLVLQGVITPEDARVYLQEETQLRGIDVPPEYINTAVEQMEYLVDVGRQGGMTAEMRARLAEARAQQEANARARTQAVVESAQARGVGGSGIELGSRLLLEQEAANRAALSGTQAAADAEARALESIVAAGELGRGLQSQEFGQQADIAAAQDAINKFNTGAQQNVEMANLSARERANYANLGERQRIADANVAARNVEELRRRNFEQQRFANDLAKAGAISGEYSEWATEEEKRKAQEKAAEMGFWSGLIKTGATVAGGIYGGPAGAAAAGKAADMVIPEQDPSEYQDTDYA